MSLRPEQAALAADLVPKLAIFAGLPVPLIPVIVEVLEARLLARQKVVLLDQELSRTLFLLAKGRVSVTRRAKGQKMAVATLAAPDFFGERSMFSDVPAGAQIKTEDESLLFLLSREAFDALAAKHPALGLLIERNLEAIETRRPSPVAPPASDA